MRGKDQAILAGCSGWMKAGCLYIHLLWVDKSLRDKGYGIRLLQAAESFGKKNGCLFAVLDTMSCQALDFYKKLGYKVEFERGYQKNQISYYYLRKDL